jgi:hypothetical protein
MATARKTPEPALASRFKTVEDKLDKAVEKTDKLDFYLVGAIDEATGKPYNGIIRRVEKIETSLLRHDKTLKIGFGVLGLMGAANFLKLNLHDIVPFVTELTKVFQ